MGVPDGMLPHTVTVVRPAQTENSYGDAVLDFGVAAARTTVRAWLEQDRREERLADGRDPLDQRWLLVTNHQDVRGRDRVEWTGPGGPMVFEVDGDPAPTYTPVGFHHTEATLRIVGG